MSEDDAVQILKKLAIVFPDWAKWSASLPDSSTYTAWISALMTVDSHHAAAVVSDWQFGRRTCPQTFERERIVYMAVEAARQLRSKEFERQQAKNATKSYHAQAAEAAARRAGYRSPLDKGLGNAIREINRIADSIGKPKSQWTDEDTARYFEQVDKITESYAKTLDRA